MAGLSSTDRENGGKLDLHGFDVGAVRADATADDGRGCGCILEGGQVAAEFLVEVEADAREVGPTWVAEVYTAVTRVVEDGNSTELGDVSAGINLEIRDGGPRYRVDAEGEIEEVVETVVVEVVVVSSIPGIGRASEVSYPPGLQGG